MARKVKEEAYAVRRNEILDAAQKLVYAKGYEQMSIQDILDELNISKGAFYHYFDSKQALLEAMIDHMIELAIQVITPIVNDPNLSAIAKIEKYFDSAARWKTTQKDYILSLMHSWFRDENAIVRQKVMSEGVKKITPQLAVIVQQGKEEGVFTTAYPEQVGQMVFSMINGLSDGIVEMLLSDKPTDIKLRYLEDFSLAYFEAIERLLGAKPGSLHLYDLEILKDWVTEPEKEEAGKP